MKIEASQFADTETVVKIAGDVSGQEVRLVHQFSFGGDRSVNEQLMQLFFMAQQLKANGAKRVTVFMPYLPYARQCKDFTGNVVGPFAAVGACCNAVGIDAVTACDLHEPACGKVFAVPLTEISLDNVWRDVLRAYDNLCFVSPDRGGVERVKRVSGEKECVYIEKERTGKDESRALRLVGDVAGRDVVLIDDIVDTGTTVLHAIELLQKRGAKKIFGCFSHAVLSGGAAEKLERSLIEKIWVTDTILLNEKKLPSKFTVIPVTNKLSQEVS